MATTAETYDDFIDDDYDWQPPTEEEMKAIEARRARSDQISRDIGAKLLQGWALMDLICPSKSCGTPLMRDPQKRLWCLNCNLQVIQPHEYDPSKHMAVGDNQPSPTAETPKPTEPAPGPSASAAPKSQAESPSSSPSSTSTSTASAVAPSPAPASNTPVQNAPAVTSIRNEETRPLYHATSNSTVVSDAIAALEKQLARATSQLSSAHTSIEDATRTCELIRSCAAALDAAHKASMHYAPTAQRD